jgi:hypothetical protein
MLKILVILREQLEQRLEIWRTMQRVYIIILVMRDFMLFILLAGISIW